MAALLPTQSPADFVMVNRIVGCWVCWVSSTAAP
jgi:hypothetical protein